MNEKSRLRSLRFYLNQEMHPDAKKAIIKKIKMVLSICNEFDSDPIDYYRYLGKQTIRLELIQEANKMIMDHIGRYQYILPWALELWELKSGCEALIRTTKEMLRSLIAHGISDGLYHPTDTEPKTTTPADTGGSNKGSMI